MTSTTHLTQPFGVSRKALLAFIRSKVADADAAEDILQDSLLKALRAAPDVRSDERIVSWFYQIVRNAITDHYRQQARQTQYHESYTRGLDTVVTPEEEAQLCRCIEGLIPQLKTEYADVLQRVDLGEEPAEEAAMALGITTDNLKVRRMRARRQLKEKLESVCRSCAAHGCLDCSCGTGPGKESKTGTVTPAE